MTISYEYLFFYFLLIEYRIYYFTIIKLQSSIYRYNICKNLCHIHLKIKYNYCYYFMFIKCIYLKKMIFLLKTLMGVCIDNDIFEFKFCIQIDKGV